MLIGEFNALSDVRNDDLGRLFFGQFVVGIVAGLIFGEKAGIGEFADVVIEAPVRTSCTFAPILAATSAARLPT